MHTVKQLTACAVATTGNTTTAGVTLVCGARLAGAPDLAFAHMYENEAVTLHFCTRCSTECGSHTTVRMICLLALVDPFRI